ncbi:MAG: GntR family transcriptional regulator [Burkholderiales bacterium]|nr:GntR family transcriptional regulator [Burkholderiales bacterium]
MKSRSSTTAGAAPGDAAQPPATPLADLVAGIRLDAASSRPYYLQLCEQLQALIDSGRLPSGQNLPAERVLAEMLDVSRATVKRCYDRLRQAQALSTHGRGGTVVRATPRLAPELRQLKGFTQEMRELGMTPSSQLLERAVVQDRTMASVFCRPSTASFLKLVRLRLADDCPMSREVAWYDLTLAPALADWDANGSAYTFLKERCGIHLGDADQSIEAVMSSEEETRVFGFTEPGPCLLLKRHTYTTHRQLVEYVEGTFRGDAYAYRIRMQSDRA